MMNSRLQPGNIHYNKAKINDKNSSLKSGKYIMKKEKKPMSVKGLIIGLCIGIAIGTSIGLMTKDYWTWGPVGLAIGVCFGAAFSQHPRWKKHKENKGEDNDADK